VSHALPIIWALIPARAIGVAVVALPLIASRSLVLTRRAVPLVIASGVCEVAGFASYAAGSRHGIAVSAVLASQFAALSAVGGYFLFRERLTRIQLAGVGAIVVGVAVLSATS
jgi:drug/metabolite transporter (DMT)-like permease